MNMPSLTGNVGENEANALHDVALVQAMLQAIRDPQGLRYYASDYDGLFGPITRGAILAFQRDEGLTATGLGVVAPGSATLQRMVALLPPELQDMMILSGTRIVYLAASEELFRGARGRVTGFNKLRPAFKNKVLRLFDQMFATHRIAMTVNDKEGHFRTFDQQAKISSDVGPGESFHNFGLAADVPFNTLKFIRPDGTPMDGGDPTFDRLRALDLGTWLKFWDARDSIAKRLMLFPIGAKDRPHLQDDLKISGGRSLVTLLNRRRTMNWDFRKGSPNTYKSDFGQGGKPVPVGNAKQIWSGKAPLNRQDIARTFGLSVSGVKNTVIDRLRRTLQDEFAWAEKNWRQWRPIR